MQAAQASGAPTIRNRTAHAASIVFLVAALIVFLGSVLILGSEEQFHDLKLRLRNQHLERQMQLVEHKVRCISSRLVTLLSIFFFENFLFPADATNRFST